MIRVRVTLNFGSLTQEMGAGVFMCAAVGVAVGEVVGNATGDIVCNVTGDSVGNADGAARVGVGVRDGFGVEVVAVVGAGVGAGVGT